MMEVHVILIVLLTIFAILAVELRDLLKAILAFTGVSIVLSAIFYLLGAPYLAVFQLLIYAGAVTVLFLAALHAGEERGE
ncbi:MAG: NADH-quinone oxidoreductase subunit J [Thaumarchaeota archaeon]|nr:NADH-quinone oxidoreductase subunit J [Nitrososphaerota archaeon]